MFLGRIRETLAQTSALPELFHDITAAIQQVFGYPLVSLLLIEDDQIKPQASFGYVAAGPPAPGERLTRSTSAFSAGWPAAARRRSSAT